LQGVKPLPMQAATGQTYGKHAEQIAAQRAVPMAGPPSTATAPAPHASAPIRPVQGPLPGQVLPLDAPSTRPNEPLTAGMPLGAGPGPEALGDLAGIGEDVNMALRAIFNRFPNEDLRRVLEMIDTDDGSGLS
jgi:hypothetical protein